MAGDKLVAQDIQAEVDRNFDAGTLDGLYTSTDGGKSWRYVKQGIRALTITTFALDPQTPTTLYAGSGGMVFKSTDSGQHWQDITQWVINPQAQPLPAARLPAGAQQ